MNPDAEENGLDDARLRARLLKLYLSSLLFQRRAMWCMSFRRWPSKPPMMYMRFLKMMARWKVRG